MVMLWLECHSTASADRNSWLDEYNEVGDIGQHSPTNIQGSMSLNMNQIHFLELLVFSEK